MKQFIYVCCAFFALTFASCVKQVDVPADPAALAPPNGFLWETSSDITVKVAIKDPRFSTGLHVISIFDKDPAEGGQLLSKGTALTNEPFVTTLYLTDTLESLFIVKTAPDRSAMQQIVAINGNMLDLTLGVLPVPAGKPMEGPDCTTGCGRTITKSENNIEVKEGEVICVTGNDITIGFTANNKGTIRICGTGVAVETANLNNGSKLIVAASGSVRFSSLNINTGIGFENYGTSEINNAFAPNGPVVNTGEITVKGDFNINQSATLVTSGTITATGSMTINSKGNSNKGSISINHFSVNGEAAFTNLCHLAIAGNYSNNGKMDNYQLVTVGGATTVNSSSHLSLYNSAMLTTKEITLNSKISGYGTTSLVKVAERTTINSSAGAKGAIQFCDANGIETNWGGKNAFSDGATEDCSVYIPTGDCNAIGNGKPTFADADKDGVADELDEYPDDVLRAFNNYYPGGKSNATVAFEDLWPSKGDYDFNDLVIDYRYNIITNSENNVSAVNAKFNLLATGGSLANAFAVEFPLAASKVNSVEGATLEATQEQAVIVLFNDMRKELTSPNVFEPHPQGATKAYDVSFEVKNGPSLKEFGLSTYNPFIFNSGTATAKERDEIHLPGHAPTPLGQFSKFGQQDDNSDLSANRYYLTKEGMPWAIAVPITFKYPKEMASIQKAYHKFTKWANSGGVAHPDWYVDKDGYRENSLIYKP